MIYSFFIQIDLLRNKNVYNGKKEFQLIYLPFYSYVCCPDLTKEIKKDHFYLIAFTIVANLYSAYNQ